MGTMRPTLEVRTIFNHYYDEDYDDFFTFREIVDTLYNNIGYKDNRRDKRFIVKFYDLPEEAYDSTSFEDFCEVTYVDFMQTLIDADIDIDKLLTSHTVGNYRAFKVYIPEITSNNIYELAKEIYDETQDAQYVEDYITTTNLLQALEDDYKDAWADYKAGLEELEIYD